MLHWHNRDMFVRSLDTMVGVVGPRFDSSIRFSTSCACCAGGDHKYSLTAPAVDVGPWEPNALNIPGNASTQATISAPGSRTDVIETIGDSDWFRVTLTAGQTYSFALTGSGQTPLDDPFLTLRNGAGSALIFDDDSGPGLNAFIASFTAATTGTYFLDATGFGGATGQYTLEVFLQNNGPPDSIPGDATTTANLSLGGSVSGVVDTAGDDDWYRIELVAGQSYVFTLNASGSAPVADAYLELFNSSGQLIARDDDAGVGLNSLLRFTATQSGTYYINARAFEDDTGPTLTGGYTLSFNAGPRQDPLDTIDLGFALNTTNVTVYFAVEGETIQGFTAARNWSTAEISSAFQAMATYSAVTNLTFTQVFSSTQATWTLILSDLPGNTLGQFGGNSFGGVGVFDHTQTTWTTAGGLSPGGVGFTTLLHEFGHGLGLAHPHDNGGLGDNDSEIMQGVISDFNSLGTFNLNQGVFTTMTYNDGYPQLGLSGQLNYGNQATPMALDIALLQQRYGSDPNTGAGDTVYVLPGANVAGTHFSAIWDTGGIDTIESAGANGATIDLRAATIQSEQGGGGYVSSVAGVRGGFTIAAGVVIENATGGSGSDTLRGNAVANLLSGNGGADSLLGFDGDDTLRGGAGGDALDGGSGFDTASYSTAAAGVTVNLGALAQNTGEAAGDSFTSIEAVEGSGFGDSLLGDGGGNILRGLAGADFIAGGGGDDTLIGDAGADALTGGDGNDILQGGDANDYLDGGGGVDTLIGGAGDDTYVISDTSDEFQEQAGGGVDNLYTYLSATLGANFENLVLLGTATTATGNSQSNGMLGNEQNNVLSGLAGDDAINGGGGDDYIDGGAGADALAGGLGNDTFVITDALDQVQEGINEGIDNLYTYVSTSLFANVENLVLLTGAINGIGNELANGILGNSANNILGGQDGADYIDAGAGNDYVDGGAGADTLLGGIGDDTFVIDNEGDQAQENNGAGVDNVYTTISFTLAENLENLVLLGSAAIGIGNSLANGILGNAAANTLGGGGGDDYIDAAGGNDYIDGGSGTDTLVGGAGNDTFIFDVASDQAIEFFGQGVDNVYSYANTMLGAHIENLVLLGSAQIGVGNELANGILGNASANVLSGLDGDDFIDAGGGTDTISGGLGGDAFLLRAGEADGDIITDFDGSVLNERLVFTGYGTAAQGASIVQINATEWRITSADGLTQDIITLQNGATLSSDDYIFS